MDRPRSHRSTNIAAKSVPDREPDTLRIGTRGSALALAQAGVAAEPLGRVELVEITTSGDQGESGDKSRFVDGVEGALRRGEVDLAIHSAKDLPGSDSPELEIVAAVKRETPQDAVATATGAASLADLPEGARIGTSSLRRRAQLLACRADLNPVPMRGNVDTRLAKLGAGEVDALVLASAGLRRLGLEDEIAFSLDPHGFTPSPGQGTVVIQARKGDPAGARAAIANDQTALAELICERTAARRLGATCDSAVGVLAEREGESLRARAWCGLPDGSDWISDSVEGDLSDPSSLGERVAERLIAAGAEEILERSATMVEQGESA